MVRLQSIDAPDANPEADCLDGFAHPRFAETVYGHDEAAARLADALASQRMHHAWLLTGPGGIGKATLAYRFARAALARDDERPMFADGLSVQPGSTADRQVAQLSHPGLLVIRRPYDTKTKRHPQTIPVDEVRRLKGFLSLTADAGARRVVIVDSADELNINAANALLKSLEEPPARLVFLLISASPGRLLPTIRSRCRTLPLVALKEPDLNKAVTAALAAVDKPKPDAAAWAQLVRLSGGSVRRALALHDGGGLQLQAHIDRFLSQLPKVDQKAAHRLADELQSASNSQNFSLFFELLDESLSRLVRAAATGDGTELDNSLAARLIDSQRLAAFAELWEILGRDKADTMALNLDRKSLVLNSLNRIEAAARH